MSVRKDTPGGTRRHRRKAEERKYKEENPRACSAESRDISFYAAFTKSREARVSLEFVLAITDWSRTLLPLAPFLWKERGSTWNVGTKKTRDVDEGADGLLYCNTLYVWKGRSISRVILNFASFVRVPNWKTFIWRRHVWDAFPIAERFRGLRLSKGQQRTKKCKKKAIVQDRCPPLLLKKKS